MIAEKHIRKIFDELYPTGRAWKYVRSGNNIEGGNNAFVDGLDVEFTDGVGSVFTDGSSITGNDGKKLQNARIKSYVRAYQDLINLLSQRIPDNDLFDEIDADNWERVYGLVPKDGVSLENRKNAIRTRMSHPNNILARQTSEFIQQYLRGYGFMVWVHENRVYDGVDSFETLRVDSQLFNEGVFNVMYFGGASQSYTEIVKDYYESEIDQELLIEQEYQNASTFFISGETINDKASIPSNRKEEFRHAILRIKPAHTVALLNVQYDDPLTIDTELDPDAVIHPDAEFYE